jgi:hypothetical protein
MPVNCRGAIRKLQAVIDRGDPTRRTRRQQGKPEVEAAALATAGRSQK